MIKYITRAVLVSLLLLNFNFCTAQFFTPRDYPKNYFIYPVVASKGLVANFGELRPNHYHMGLDCRTDKVQNKKVLAAASGYIAKVKIEPFGFGRCIYINHPNGLTTVYAHLNDFFPALEQYVKNMQYKMKSWAVFLDIPAGLFPVQKADTIALSGNTGGSQGPHVHFEIRDTKTDKVLNPLLFGFDIPDNIAPSVTRLAIYDRNFSTYEQSPKIFSLKKTKDTFAPNPALIKVSSNRISFGITATDRFNESANPNGIFEAVLYENDSPVAGFRLDSISYDETRYLNAHIDYKTKSSGGGYFEHVSKLPGSNNSVYKTNGNAGVIMLTDTVIHNIRIEVKDANGNTSLVLFAVKRDANAATPPGKEITNSSGKIFLPGYLNVFDNDSMRFYLLQNCLYDSIHFQYAEIKPKQGYTIYQLHNTNVPLHSYFPVSIKAVSELPDKMVMHRFANGKDDYAKAVPVTSGKDARWYKASFRDFGSFQLMTDTTAPVITALGFKDGMDCSKQSRIVFVIKDNTEEIKSFTALLDGNWLRFSNDKGARFIYDFDEKCPAGPHELKIIAEDQVGNVAEKIYHFTR